MRGQTRRQFLKTMAMGAAALSVPLFPRVSRGAGKLMLGIIDHWTPGANDALKQMIEDWGKANKVEVQIDFITIVGEKLQATAAGEARAGTGHDIMAFHTWGGTAYKDKLEPLNDVAEAVQKKYGKYNENATWLSFQDGKWITFPATFSAQTYPLETRMDLWKKHAGIEVVDLFPPDVKKRSKAKVDTWDWKMFLEGAKKVHAAGFPVGLAISDCGDSNDWLGCCLLSHGSIPVNEKGEITIESDGTLAALDYLKELAQYLPPDVYGWDDSSNNRWLISGKGSAIFNPPSAWSIAKRDRPEVAEQVWHHDSPRGSGGRFRASKPFPWGVWSFSKNKSAAKDLLLYLSEKEPQWKMVTAGQGYDVPPLPSLLNHPLWDEIGPPKGTQYNYPIRGDERLVTCGWPAKPEYAVKIYTRYLVPHMVSRVTQQGMNPKEAIKWASKELEAYKQR